MKNLNKELNDNNTKIKYLQNDFNQKNREKQEILEELKKISENSLKLNEME